MNVKTSAEFKSLIDNIKTASVVSVDTETNGLSIHAGHRPISMSFYFPETKESFNFSFRHGIGKVKVIEKSKKPFHQLTWQGNQRAQMYKAYWWAQVMQEPDWFEFLGNVPIEWLLDLIYYWNACIVPNALVIYFNAPFDIHMMETLGMEPPRRTEDVRTAVSLVFEDWKYPHLVKNGKDIYGAQNTLKWQANYWGVAGALDGEAALQANAERLGDKLAEYILAHWDDPMNEGYHTLKRAPHLADLSKRVAPSPKSEMWMLPSDWVAEYAENDTRITWELRNILLKRLAQWHQVQLYEDINAAQLEVAIRMERNGFLLDVDVAKQQMEKLEPIKEKINTDLTAVYQTVTDDPKATFTTGSPKKLLELLNKTGVNVAATDKKTLEHWTAVHGKHEVIENVFEYRRAQRASSTYLKKWIESVDENGYVHASFNVNGTTTGRWSSSSGTLGAFGNGQNIPSRKFEVKKAIVTPAGWRLCQFDYKAIELRLAAWVADCKTMIRMMNAGEDLHTFTMHQLKVRETFFGNMSDADAVVAGKLTVKEGGDPGDAVFAYCRTVAKTCNFGLLYGGSFRVLMRLLDIDEDTARRLFDAWHSLYPEYDEANRYYKRLAMSRRPRPDGKGGVQYVTQPIGGRSRKFGLYPDSEWITAKGKTWHQNTLDRKAKDAFNAIIQGQALYIMALSALEICRTFDNSYFKPCAIIHDSIVFYLREDMLHILPEMQRLMTERWETNPPQEVSLEVSKTGSWQDLSEVKSLSVWLGLDEGEDEEAA